MHPDEKIIIVVGGLASLTIEQLDGLMGADPNEDPAMREAFLFRPSPPQVIEVLPPTKIPELRPEPLTPLDRVKERLNKGKHWLRR